MHGDDHLTAIDLLDRATGAIAPRGLRRALRLHRRRRRDRLAAARDRARRARLRADRRRSSAKSGPLARAAATPTCSRPASPASSPAATCASARSSASPPPSARAAWPSPSSTSTCARSANPPQPQPNAIRDGDLRQDCPEPALRRFCATFVRNPRRYGNFPRPARLTWRPRLPYDDARRMLMARALDVVIGCGGRAGT